MFFEVLYIFSKYIWVFPFKDKKIITITKILDKCNCKLNKVWVDKGSKFFNRSMAWLLQKNNMTSVSKNMYIDKLNDIVDEYSYTVS